MATINEIVTYTLTLTPEEAVNLKYVFDKIDNAGGIFDQYPDMNYEAFRSVYLALLSAV